MAAAMFCAMGLVAWAQEEPAAKPAPAEKPGQEQREKIAELNQQINRMVVEAAQKIPELKAMHEAQQAKWREGNQKRAELIVANPEIKKLQDELNEKRKKEREMSDEITSKNPELVELQKQLKELRAKFEEKRREVVSASPEMAALHKETLELQGKIFEAMKDMPEVKQVYAEADAAWNEMVKSAAQAEPDIAKAVAERDALMKAAAPAPAGKPKEEPK